MKVLASLKPYYYYLVGEGIKKIEVRKSEPKSKQWDRDVLFYMSKDEKSFAKIPKELQEKYRKHFGKVGLEFVCDEIFKINNLRTQFLINKNIALTNMVAKESCLDFDDMCNYLKTKDGYGLHISNLKIYDKPKELSEFKNLKGEPITRAFQSWGYVEILKLVDKIDSGEREHTTTIYTNSGNTGVNL